jgi:hypothetical protein
MLFQNIVSGELPDLDFEGRLHVVQLLPVGEYVDEDFVFVGTLDRKHIQVLLGNFEFEAFHSLSITSITYLFPKLASEHLSLLW